MNATDSRREICAPAKTERRPRICLPTFRNFTNKSFRGGLYEAQDVLLEVDDVDLVGLRQGPGFRFKHYWQQRLLYRDISRQLIFANPGLEKVRLTQEYDLFVAMFQHYPDIPYINAIEGWKDHCKTTVCWIDEFWSAAIPLCEYWLPILSRFDYVFVGYSGTVDALSNATNRSCRWLPGAVDTRRFSPYPNPPARVIDVHSIGRRWEGIHRALVQATNQNEIFYVYDTFPAAEADVYNHRQHRDLFANIAKRSRYFVVAPGKMDAPEETEGQVEIGHRYYEGAAAGAVLIGQSPNCEAFRTLFQWPDVVIPIKPDGSDVIEVLTDLRSDSARISEISRRNSAETLLRHDWIYRWKEIFRVAGIDPSPGMVARERHLKALADLVTNSA
jgi:hypothetical protein